MNSPAKWKVNEEKSQATNKLHRKFGSVRVAQWLVCLPLTLQFQFE